MTIIKRARSYPRIEPAKDRNDLRVQKPLLRTTSVSASRQSDIDKSTLRPRITGRPWEHSAVVSKYGGLRNYRRTSPLNDSMKALSVGLPAREKTRPLLLQKGH